VTLTAAPVAITSDSGGRSVRAVLGSYVALTKPRIIELLLVTTVPAMVLAARGVPNLWTLLVTLVGGTMAAGSANAINCVVDRDIDAVMTRTRRRPMARHEIPPAAALRFGIVLGALATLLLGFGANWLSAGLGVEASYPLEHRDRGGGRLLPRPDRVVGGAGRRRLAGDRAVRGGVLVDPAAFLVASDALQG
jgi:protoheme IX farnesyltransferase